jgi:HSP20 family protein
MNATISEINHVPLSWKITVLALSLTVAVLAATVGIGSYFFYRANDHETSMAQQEIAPLKPNSSSATNNTAIDPLNDWPSPSSQGITGNPWEQLNALHQRMNQMFNNALSQLPADDPTAVSGLSSPSLDVRELKDQYIIRVDMPGANKSSIKVNIEGRLLTLSGERSTVNESKSNDKVVRNERSMAQFVRTIQLPGPVKVNAVEAKYDNGVLTLNLPKADQGTSTTQVPIH